MPARAHRTNTPQRLGRARTPHAAASCAAAVHARAPSGRRVHVAACVQCRGRVRACAQVRGLLGSAWPNLVAAFNHYCKSSDITTMHAAVHVQLSGLLMLIKDANLESRVLQKQVPEVSVFLSREPLW